jgi:ABC-type phosphate/phosphonate transport system substrate-binding protein
MRPACRFLTVLLLLFSAVRGALGLPLRIGVPAGESGVETLRCWSALGEALKSRGVDVSIEVLENNAAVARSLRDRFVDVGFLDPLWYRRFSEFLLPLAEAIPTADTSVVLAVPKNSIVYRPESLVGASLALASEKDTAAGYFVPLAMLARGGVMLSDLGGLVFAETGLSVLKSVAYGGVAAGSFPAGLLAEGPHSRLSGEVRVIAESGPLPPPLLVFRRDDGEERYRRLLEELGAAASAPEASAALRSAGIAGFRPPSLGAYRNLDQYLRDYKAAYDAQD